MNRALRGLVSLGDRRGGGGIAQHIGGLPQRMSLEVRLLYSPKYPSVCVWIGRCRSNHHVGIPLSRPRLALFPMSCCSFHPLRGCPSRGRSPRTLKATLLSAAVSALVVTSPPAARAGSSLDAPVRVPLRWMPITSSSQPAPRKLGIHVALGGSTTPQLFEFDTGGAGFFPTYASSGTTPSTPWWGDGGTTTGFHFEQKYDDGAIKYRGDVVRTSVSLFASPTSPLPLFTASDVLVGRTATINDKPLEPPFASPPLEGAFWGDFGMALKQGKEGKGDPGGSGGPSIDSLLAQITYGAGVTAGYRVHAASEKPWVQFGLGPADQVWLPTTFGLNPPDPGSPTASPVGVPYFNDMVVSGTLALNGGNPPFNRPATGLIFDTGAHTTIHNHDHIVPATLSQGKQVLEGMGVWVGAPRRMAGGGMGPVEPFLSFAAGSTINDDLVWVKNGSNYYFNTGLLPFLENDLIVNLEAGTLTLAPPTVPGPVPWLALPVVAGLRRFLRRRCGVRPRRPTAAVMPPLGAPASSPTPCGSPTSTPLKLCRR